MRLSGAVLIFYTKIKIFVTVIFYVYIFEIVFFVFD